MRSLFHAATFAAAVSAAVLRREQCCFQITASGGVSGVMGTLSDGQNRLNGSYPAETYCLNNGIMTDSTGKTCLVTLDNDATHQFQCDEHPESAPLSLKTGWALSPNGYLTSQGSGQFYACPATDTEYNVYTQTLAGQEKCRPVQLSTNSRGACSGPYASGGGPSPLASPTGYYPVANGSVPAGPTGGSAPAYVPPQGYSTPIPYGSVGTATYPTPSRIAGPYMPQGPVPYPTPMQSAYTPQGTAPAYCPAPVVPYNSSGHAPVGTTSPYSPAGSAPGYGSPAQSAPGYGAPSVTTVPSYNTETAPIQSAPTGSTSIPVIETTPVISTPIVETTPVVNTPVVVTTPIMQGTTRTVYSTFVHTVPCEECEHKSTVITNSIPTEVTTTTKAVPFYPANSSIVVPSIVTSPTYTTRVATTPVPGTVSAAGHPPFPGINSSTVPSVKTPPVYTTQVVSTPVVSVPTVTEATTYYTTVPCEKTRTQGGSTTIYTVWTTQPVVNTPPTSAVSVGISSVPTSGWTYPSGRNSSLVPSGTAPTGYVTTTATFSTGYPSVTSPVASGAIPPSNSTLIISTTVTTPVASAPGYGTPKVSAASPTLPATSASGTATACQTELSGAYQTPHLITWVAEKYPNKPYGSQYNASINSDCSTIMNFDIPASYEGKTCSVIFLFPKQADLETSAYTFGGSGELSFSSLSGVATTQTTYNNAPAVNATLETIAIQPGNSYVVATTPCQAGTTQSIELSSKNGLTLEFFEDWNPSSLGLYVTAC